MNKELKSPQRLATELAARSLKIVLAESCTCGMAAAMLGAVPGISNFFCGSAVTYRIATKTSWLGLKHSEIEQFSAESLVTSREMAAAVLENTQEATWSAAITGNLGPNAGSTDGMVFIAIANRRGEEVKVCAEKTIELKHSDRLARQSEAATLLLDCLTETLQGTA